MQRSVLITGASGNLGKAVSARLLSDGFELYTTLMPQETAAAAAGIFARVTDLTAEEDCTSYVAEIGRKSSLEAGILLVGGFAMGEIASTGLESIKQMIGLNFYTAFPMAKALFGHFEKNGGGQIILIGARPALRPEQGKGVAAYALSKGLVFHLAELINEAGKEKNIRATVLVPSTIDTALNRQSMPDADFSKWVPASDIADVIAFLLTGSGSILRETVLKVYNSA